VIHITETTVFDDHEINERFVRAASRGCARHVNRAATAVELRVDLARSALPLDVKQRLIALAGRHVTADGVLVIVGRADRSQARNREAARSRLLQLLERASNAPRTRKPTRISGAIRRERLAAKRRHGEVKRERHGNAPD
jgi:ribosome-associated protein